jgi:hypothetical protein
MAEPNLKEQLKAKMKILESTITQASKDFEDETGLRILGFSLMRINAGVPEQRMIAGVSFKVIF